MSKFNLVDKKWIPVRFLNGDRDELGISATLLRSREIAAIEDPSPLVVAALHRFLLAVLYRALDGPTDIEQAKALFKAGLPEDKIIAYLKKWEYRFWLFDEKYPFYQVPAYEPQEKKGIKEWKPWSAISAEHNANNAKVLFDHVGMSDAGAIPTKIALRWLLACQTFALGGGNSDFVYTKSAPSATAMMVIPFGENLHDTLLLSLVPQNREIIAEDCPIWEQVPASLSALKNGDARPATGVADLYTWLTRSVKFSISGDGEKLCELALASGIECSSETFIDPLLGYRIDEEKGKLPYQFRERGIWRDFDSLLPDDSKLGPKVVEHAAALTRVSKERFPKSVMVLGQANNKAKIEYWRMERFCLPEALIGDHFIRTEIRQLLVIAEETQKSLWSACRSFARDILSRGARDPAAKDIKSVIEQMPVNADYWSFLESSFHKILSEYTLACEYDDIRLLWLKFVKNALQTAWNQHCTAVSAGDAWAIRALVKAEKPIRIKLKELNEEIKKLAPVKEGP